MNSTKSYLILSGSILVKIYILHKLPIFTVLWSNSPGFRLVSQLFASIHTKVWFSHGMPHFTQSRTIKQYHIYSVKSRQTDSEFWADFGVKLTIRWVKISAAIWKNIMKTCLYNFDPLKPHFYIVKLGFTGVYIIFHISAAVLTSTHNLCFEQSRRF